MPTTKRIQFPWGVIHARTTRPERDVTTNLIYYGGKSRDADWIIKNFPHGWKTFIDVFGGGGAISFRLPHVDSRVYIYNDIGNVYNFMRVMREQGEELYRQLYMTPFSRQEFEKCVETIHETMVSGTQIEWARQWFTIINQGYTHEEDCTSWHVAKQVNSSRALAHHADDVLVLMRKLRNIHLEHLSFERLIPLYDLADGSAFFYMDPPYVKETRADFGNYRNEMTIEKHEEMLQLAVGLKGQCIISGYDHPLYNQYLKDWHRAEKTAKSAIQNSSSMDNRGTRTEVLWIKEHNHGLWSEEGTSSYVS